MAESDSEKQTFKKKLAQVFDDDFRTRPLEWKNYVDFVIIGMIVLSTVSVFLGTFQLSEGFRRCLNVFDWIVQIFFTVEVSLRIWAADEISDKYKGFGGRVLYCLTFFGLVDFLATYPVWLGIAFPGLMSAGVLQLFRVLRVARLFRVFHYMKSFRFLGTAIQSKKKEILMSLGFITVITVILSFILFLVEHDANPEMIRDGWKSLVWSFSKYIGDPGLITDIPLETPGGSAIAFLIGIMAIAFFAVPIGLLSAGFQETIEKDTREKELIEFKDKVKRLFRRNVDKSFREYLEDLPDGEGDDFKSLIFVPARVSVAKLQVRQGMTLDDVIETCKESTDFRLKNLTSAVSDEDLAADKFIVEHFPLNTEYGCKIQRNSRVTIVCTSSWDEVGIGWFTYYLALFGGFNYVSREVKKSEEPDSYFSFTPGISKDLKKKRKVFLEDVYSGENTEWVIIFDEHLKNSANTVDFHFADTLKDGSSSTVTDQDLYKRFVDRFSTLMKKEFQLETSAPSKRYPLFKGNLGYKIRKNRPDINAFVLRPSSEIINFNSRKLCIAYRMALIISEMLDPGHGIRPEDVAEMKKRGEGYVVEEKEDKKD
jgi:voltage-gated potassium channel